MPFFVHSLQGTYCAFVCTFVHQVCFSGNFLNSFSRSCLPKRNLPIRRNLNCPVYVLPWTCSMLFSGHALCLFCALLVHPGRCTTSGRNNLSGVKLRWRPAVRCRVLVDPPLNRSNPKPTRRSV